MSEILRRDSDIPFPHFAVLKASAGSGKTHTLTKRIVQFLLSEKIPGNSLGNILAITFSNNAAKEMRERTLQWLKSISFDDPEKTAELSQIVSLDRGELTAKAGRLLEEILDNYPDFQVRTIDSFMAAVFKSSAIDFGYNPEFDILLNIDPVMEYAFDLFLKEVRDGTEEAVLMARVVSLVMGQKKKEDAYLWDPSAALLNEIKKLYGKLAAAGKRPTIEDLSREAAALKDRMKTMAEGIESAVSKSGLDRRANSAYVTVLPLVREKRFADLIGKGMKNPPVNKPKKGQSTAEFDLIVKMWEEFSELARQYTALSVRTCFTPYLRVYEEFKRTLEAVKKNQGKVFIGDINGKLSEYLDVEIVPDIYFRIGETIFHYLIDEFQDTSPVQWRNLFPLIENSLSQGGSAFVVGDTKQAIYGFRDADYTIMKAFEKQNPFPSAKHIVEELGTNYRSLSRILEFNEKVFRDTLDAKEEYREAAGRSGLTDYVQKVSDGRESPGYSEVSILEKDEDDPPEKKKIQGLVAELTSRGFGYGDIAILTPKNEDAIRATVWLNEKDIRFVSYSSLDIRRRKITGEIVALLNFLDSPLDDLSFATFLLGDIFAGALSLHPAGAGREALRAFIFSHRNAPPLYKAFQGEFQDLWDEFFSDLFRSSGYFPLYDLLCQIFNVFRVFQVLADEEATLVKILEVVKDFEGEGYNSLKDFLALAGDGDAGEARWDMDVPGDIDAVKVMTVHKAKGLGFPVVIILLYEERKRGFDYIIQEDGEGIRLLKITRETRDSDPVFACLYAEETIRERVNRLNSLYVGFTRPEEELYVIGVKGGSNKVYPLDILPEDEQSSPAKPLRAKAPPAEAPPSFALNHLHRRIEFTSGAREMLNLADRRRGEFVHKVLSFIEYVDGGGEALLSGAIKRVLEETGGRYAEKEMEESLAGFIGGEELREYFRNKAGRTVMTEQEFADREGNLFRMDRVVLDPETVTVIDYKTGSDGDSAEKYVEQLRRYMRLLESLYPDKKVVGIIAHADQGWTRREA